MINIVIKNGTEINNPLTKIGQKYVEKLNEKGLER